MNAEEFYVSLGRLLEQAPKFRPEERTNDEETRWMASAYALMAKMKLHAEADTIRALMSQVASAVEYQRKVAIAAMLGAVHRALAVAELDAPTAVRGAFISAGNAFDAMTAVGRVLATAKETARIVDPYMDDKALTDFAVLAHAAVGIELLADRATVKPSLEPAVKRWKQQYPDGRQLVARLSTPRALHDRLIVVDSRDVWTLTQSLNAFAARSPASIVRIDSDAAALKIAAYEAFWQSASVLA